MPKKVPARGMAKFAARRKSSGQTAVGGKVTKRSYDPVKPTSISRHVATENYMVFLEGLLGEAAEFAAEKMATSPAEKRKRSDNEKIAAAARALIADLRADRENLPDGI